MEPKLAAPNLGPEHLPPQYGQNFEQGPVVPQPETNIERHAEKLEQRSEALSSAAQAATLPAPIALPTLHPTTSASDDSTSVAADVPLVANDDDLIEKEWVEKAKKIIVQTKDDPYLREKEVGKLQVEYLRKRYGKELGAS